MRQADFEASPSKSRHPSYSDSMLYTTAPEWSTGEGWLASAYRSFILGIPESEINLDNIERAQASMPLAVGGPELWSHLLNDRGGIASPLKHGQHSPVASRQLMPIVPSVARIAGVLGKRPRSRWNPSNLILETIGAGLGPFEGVNLVRQFGDAMLVTADDDIFARFIESALPQGMQGLNQQPGAMPPYQDPAYTIEESFARAFRSPGNPRSLSPAERFCQDLPAVLEIKTALTRRQWTVLVESILRIGLGMHVLWTCNANVITWELVLDVASGAPTPTAADIEATIWEGQGQPQALLELGSDAEPIIKRLIERYAFARTGLNLLLCRLHDVGAALGNAVSLGYAAPPSPTAPAAIANLLAHVARHRHQIDPSDAGIWLRRQVTRLFDEGDESKDLRSLAKCRSGYTKNLLEFARHSLGQIKAKEPEQRCYDLAYLLAYSGERKPLTVHPGPAMLVLLVHGCCRANPQVPASLDDFRRYLREYGLNARAGELVDGKTGRDLSMLGLVIDSPDAAGGRLLVPPL